ncbi:hypothetical protein ACFP81_05040 [Deinococcus lacus]|uniref:DUF7674 domain-containing protein n=1 Tax=Deinococcus lacus TaxID=392561 RepID=A0ABW1YBS4_9DEIO
MARIHEYTNQFLSEAMRLLPETREEICSNYGLLHAQMGCIWLVARDSIQRKDWQKYEAICSLIDKYFLPNDDDLIPFTNAVNVSFLEGLPLWGEAEGDNAEAWAHTPPKLQQGFREMEEYMQNLAEAGKKLGLS